MTVASIITLVRIAFIPIYMALMHFSYGQPGLFMWSALGVFILASITDFVDGFIARKYHQISDFGKFLDPLADKITQFTLILCLAIRYPVLWNVLALFVMKELFQLIAGALAAHKGYILKGALFSGKVCTTVLFTSLVALVVIPNMDTTTVSLIAMVDGFFLMVAFADYFITYLGKKFRFQSLDDEPSAGFQKEER